MGGKILLGLFAITLTISAALVKFSDQALPPDKQTTIASYLDADFHPDLSSGGTVSYLVQPALHAEVHYGTNRKWVPFYYLVRKPKTKVSEITAKFLHADPGLRGI